jgi:glycine cleavage system protein P-like pyridoxal-binding family
MAGLKVVPVKALADGSLDLEDLQTKAENHKENLAAFMVGFSPKLLCVLLKAITDYLSFNVWGIRVWCSRGLYHGQH